MWTTIRKIMTPFIFVFSFIVLTACSGSGSGAGGNNGTQSTDITLNWVVPTKNTNGTALTDLVGYKIYYGTTVDSMSNVIVLDDVTLSSYTVTNLDANTLYYFKISAVNFDNKESSFSNLASKNISG